MFRTGDAVKSCAAVDPLTGLAIVGSHDGHVYALDPVQQRCVWKRHCAGGAVFSSPYLHTRRRRLYVATLGGALLCLRPVSKEQMCLRAVGMASNTSVVVLFRRVERWRGLVRETLLSSLHQTAPPATS